MFKIIFFYNKDMKKIYKNIENNQNEIDKKENIYIFIHSEWTDTCTLDEINKTICRKLYNEIGTFYYDNNKIIINWHKWKDEDIFIYIYNCYYHINFFNKYINNFDIDIIDLYFDKLNKKFIINKN